MSPAVPLKVILTIDTELWPIYPGWPGRTLPPGKAALDDALAADIHGLTSAGGFGLPFQIGMFNQHGLKANFFVESLFASSSPAAASKLAHIARLVQASGHEVQLHLHTEWLRELNEPGLPGDVCQFMSALSLPQQSTLIRKALDNLARAGVDKVHAFRAGSFGANLDTLRALAQHGIGIDSSYNPSHLRSDWGGMRIDQPCRLGNVWEFPVSSFTDWPGHVRHAQLCAVSFAEMHGALQAAHRDGWPAFVIVLHSFELVKRYKTDRLPTPHRSAVRRFEQLCTLLGQQQDRYQTVMFSQLPLHALPMQSHHSPLHSPVAATLRRMAEQAWSRIR
jgi:hypothetical protein